MKNSHWQRARVENEIDWKRFFEFQHAVLEKTLDINVVKLGNSQPLTHGKCFDCKICSCLSAIQIQKQPLFACDFSTNISMLFHVILKSKPTKRYAFSNLITDIYFFVFANLMIQFEYV